jgi:hypothetical protein
MNYDVVRRERGRSWKMSAGGRIGLADVTQDLAVARGTWHHPVLIFESFTLSNSLSKSDELEYIGILHYINPFMFLFLLHPYVHLLRHINYITNMNQTGETPVN